MYVVVFVEFELMRSVLPDEVEVTPKADKLAFAFIADASEDAIDTKVSPAKTV